jgi:hypothetical protein
MFKVCTRIIGLAAVLATLGAASVASADSGPTPEAIATLRMAGGLDPYDTSKDTYVATNRKHKARHARHRRHHR